jgi:uncharacterized protein YhbP (UPF0306 family)
MLFVHCWYIQSESDRHAEVKGSDPSEFIVIKDAFRHSKLESPSTPVTITKCQQTKNIALGGVEEKKSVIRT